MSVKSFLHKHRYPFMLCVAIVSLLLMMEAAHPYFFFQDDNRDQNLPYYVANYRAVMNGELPLFNFNQFLGTPLLSCIQSAAFYPINYLALFLSKIFWGDFFATIDIIAFFHLLIAGTGFYYFMRFFGLNEKACFFGAIAWSFCGFVICIGSAWVAILGHAAYLPWLFFLAIRLYKNASFNTFLLLVLIRPLPFLIGYPQIFVYSVTFEIITLFLIHLIANPKQTGKDHDPIKFLKYYVAHYICVLLLIAPVLLPGLHQVSISAQRKNVFSWEAYSSFSYNITDWILGIINPFTSHSVDQPELISHGGVVASQSGFNESFISHIGLITAAFVLYALATKKNGRDKYIYVYVIMSIFTLLFACNVGVAKLFYLLPIYNKFRWPFKAAFFTSFYLIIIATYGFDSFYNKLAAIKNIRPLVVTSSFVFIMCLHLFNFALIYVLMPEKILGCQLDDVPFDEPLKNTINTGRIISLGPKDHAGSAASTAHYLGYNYATLWNLKHFTGYEILLSEKNSEACLVNAKINIDSLPYASQMPILNYFRKWGVQWYVVEKNRRPEFLNELQLKYSDKSRNVYFDRLAFPLVFWKSSLIAGNVHDGGLSHQFTTNTVQITTNGSSADELYINVLYNPFFSAYVDGNKQEIAETDGQQMSVPVPGGHHEVKIVYSDPYFTVGITVTALFILIAATGMFRYRRKIFPSVC